MTVQSIRNKVLVKINWISSEEGGRKYLPSGSQYSTVARFEGLAHKWPEEAWSVVVEFIKENNSRIYDLAEVRFLAPNAPPNLLLEGNKFDLFEGHRLVAHCEVVEHLSKKDRKLQVVPIQG